MKKTKNSLLHSVIALLLCISMLIGTTFAWFSDKITSGKNIITAGNLDLEMYWTDDLESGEWHNVEEDGHNTIFSYDNWEPGYTEVKYIKLVNAGELALNYELTISPTGEVGKLAEVINVFYANDGVKVENRSDLSKLSAIGLLNNVMDGGATADGTLLAADQQSPWHTSGEVIITLAMNMITTAGNEYQDETIGDGFTITALATQAPYEEDSFGSDYDTNAEYPEVIKPGKVSAPVTPVDGKVPAGGVTLAGSGISATVPEGVVLEDGVDTLTLAVTPLEHTTSDITVVNNEILIPVDVHIEGVSANNTTPIIIDLGEILPKYLNMGNYKLFHVENGATSEMTLVDDKSELTAHNTFTYDPLTGGVSVAMASFSEVTLVANIAKPWEGEVDFSWYDVSKTELTIANADQLHAFSQIVGGMVSEIDRDSFKGKTVKLLSDINLNHGNVVPETEKENATTTIFYPIGYYNDKNFVSSNDINRPTNVEGNAASTVYSFSGVFDGDGHKISNFYQNTWEMFGDYNNGYSGTPNYYKDAMGLFGYVNGGTVQNLTVDRFESDGEFTPTGVIAAYAADATFKNIAIVNCNPRVYNTGNGGIVGVGGNTDDTYDNNHLTFTNITVDNSNIISALWGSWDVACGGIMGMFRGYSAVKFTNCHVAAQIDVYNDVCGNYQYYWYRYAGMMIGSLRGRNTTDAEGYTVPNMDYIEAVGCTVRFDEWNDYYYCELVDNSIASYTHDYQFSRLEKVEKVDGTTVTYLDGTIKTVPTSGNYNYVVVTDNESPSTEEAKCYHFKNGSQWTHEMSEFEDFDVNGDGALNDYKEDHRHVYLPFNQIFQGDGWGVKHIPIDAEEGSNLNENENYKNLDIKVLARQGNSVEKFIKKFDGDFLYRVGNGNAVSLGSLFAATDAKDNKGNLIEINDESVWITVEKFNDEMDVSGIVTANSSDWTKSTIQFSGTGVVNITIQDYNYCTPTVLTVEVVDAMNTTAATSATSNNVVLLNNVSGGFSVSGNNTFYGNGFTVTLPTSSVTNKGNGFCGYVNLSNGHLDNVKIIGPVYPEQYIYRSQAEITDSSDSDYGDGYNMRYFHNSVIVNAGDCNITNSYISGSRAAIYIKDGGDVLIEDTAVSGGAYANIEVSVANSVIFKNLTTEQKEVEDSYNADGSKKKMIGLGIVIDNAETEIYVEGTLNQYNWITQTQWESLLGNYANQFPKLFTDSTYESYWHYREGDSTTKYVNLTMIFACNWNSSKLHDNRINKTGYESINVSVVSMSGGVYSPAGLGTLTDVLYLAPQYESTNHYAVPPEIEFDYTTKNYAASTEGSNEFCYEDGGIVKISFDDGSNKVWDTSILSVTKGTKTLPYTVSMNDVDYTGTTITFTTSGDYVVTYTYSDPYNYKLNSDGEIVQYSKEYQQTVHISVTAVEDNAKNAKFTMGSNGQAVDKILINNNVYLSASGLDNSSWTSGTGLKFPQKDGDTSTISFKYSGNTNGSWASATINGQTFYFPVVAMGTTDSKFAHTGSWYGCFPVFKDAITIVDYADGGTGAELEYDGSTTEMPENLKVLYPQTVFRYQGTQSKVPTTPSKMTKGTYSGILCYTTQTDLSASNTRSEEWNLATYTYQDNKGTTYYWYVAYYCEASTNGGGCVTPDTLVTLANGTQKEIQYVTYDDQLLVWNFYTGVYDTKPASALINHGEGNYTVIALHFNDGTTVKVIDEHGFFDMDKNKFVFINANNVANYIGHHFAKSNNYGFDSVVLEEYTVTEEYTTAYSILSHEYDNALVEGMLSLTPVPGVDNEAFYGCMVIGENMTYDSEAIRAYVAKHGLYTYDELAGYGITYEQYAGANLAYLKIMVGEGIVTLEQALDIVLGYVYQ